MSKKREQLRQLDKEALIDAHLLLEKRVRSLEKQVKDLKQLLLGSAGSPAKTPQNSSMPSGQSWKEKKRCQAKAKRGPKAGHVGTSRQRSEPDEIIECRVAACVQCGTDLSGLVQHEVGRHQVMATICVTDTATLTITTMNDETPEPDEVSDRYKQGYPPSGYTLGAGHGDGECDKGDGYSDNTGGDGP